VKIHQKYIKIIFSLNGTSVFCAISPSVKMTLRINPIVKNLFKLIFNEKNESKFNISYNLSLKVMEWLPLNFSHWKLPTNTKNAPQFFHLKIIIEFFKRNLLNIQLLSHYKSKKYETISMHPYSSRAFQ
jgi:hypothetical protein